MNPLEFINQIKDMYNDQDPRSMAQGSRNMYADGQLVTPSVDGARPGYRGDKTQEVLKAYKEYKKSYHSSRHKYPIIPFTKFFEMYARENFADGGMLNAMQIGENRGDRIGFRKPRKPNPVESFSPEIQERIKNFGIKKYNKLTTTQKYEVRNPRTSTTPYTFNFGKKKFDLTVKGLTKSGANNLQELLNLINEKDLTPNKWFGKTSKARKAKGGLDLLARDLVKYLQGFEISDNRGNKINQRIFDELNIKKLIGKNKIDIISQIDGKSFRQTIAKKASAKSKVEASFDAVKFINKEFMLDPDATLEELAEQIYGKGASNSVRALKDTQADVAKYLDVLKTGTRRGVKIPDFKYPSAKKVFEILDSIEDRSSTFGFDEGILRDLKFNIRDNLLNFKKGSTTSLRRMLSEVIAESNFANNVIDEAVGLSATYDKLPGYTEATQILSKELNQRKAFEIDKPFNQIINKVYDGKATSKEIKAYNAIARKFIKETKIDVPIIKSTVTGDDIKNPKKYIRNFDSFSPEAQKNILKIAKDKKFVIQTGAKPLTLQEGKATMETAKNFLNDIQANSKLDECRVDSAEGGRIGFAYSNKCIKDGLEETKKKAAAGDKKAARQLVKTAEAATKFKLLKNVLGPGAILGDAVFEGALIGNKVLGGKPLKQAWAESYFSYLDPRKYRGELDPMLMERDRLLTRTINDKIIDGPNANILRAGFAAQDQLSAANEAAAKAKKLKTASRIIKYLPAAADAREQGARANLSAKIISDEAFKDASKQAREYLDAQEGKNRFPLRQFKESIGKFESQEAKNYRQKREQEMNELFPNYSNKEIDSILDYYGEEKPDNVTYDQISEFFKNEDKTRYFLDNLRMEKAGGGLANLTDTIPPESGPMSQGLRSLYNNDMDY